MENLSGHLPTAQEGLQALVTKPAGYHHPWYQIAKELPNDSWGHPYQYKIIPGPLHGYELFSLGRDGVPSGDDIYYQPPMRSSFH